MGVTDVPQWIYFEDKHRSEFEVIAMLWEQYKGQREIGWSETPWLQRCEMLQEYIRKCMRQEQELYLLGKCTKERVSVTKGHAVLVGKIVAHEKARLATQSQQA